MTYYSLRRNLDLLDVPSARLNDEHSALPEQGLPIIGKSRFRKHHPFWFLSDPLGKAPSISMPDLRENILLQHWDSLLSTVLSTWQVFDASRGKGVMNGDLRPPLS